MAPKAGVIKRRSLEPVVRDTTMQPKAIAHPADGRLFNGASEQFVDTAKDAGIERSQSYARLGKHGEHKAACYAHATQFQRMRREIRQLRTWLGRVIRDVQHKAQAMPEALKTKLEIARRLHAQRREDKHKLYALHAPEVECLAKGKARTPYEFGVKVSVAVTAKEGLVVGMRSMPGNLCDGHTVDRQLEQVEILTDVRPKIAVVDRGYRGAHAACGTRLLVSHTRRLPRSLKKLFKRRQAIEPVIGHMKTDGLLNHDWLKGALGGAMHALLCGAGYNLRMILAHLRVLYCALAARITLAIMLTTGATSPHRAPA
ncbi:IS5 family transposase [Calidifontimicrobium sp. SYSU G02091]|uniref:IS5 family transposase n=1 Tax=Calidifontimicrobium sp. SYSU G02091 TaxID=2926421 RepID=UPI001F5347A3|nr:IS5 family transposase [Calidifontimicrobium sp. SYSU G02091]MCI1192804.1 IS5 family transposase [Calidifontimicrobium sp. SYSU G02091]